MGSVVDFFTSDLLQDPLDLGGGRAKDTQKEISDILLESAKAGIALNEEQLARIEELTAPFRAAASDVALPRLSAIARGGEVDFKTSPLFERQLETGTRGIRQQQAARGLLKSSGTSERLSDLVSGLAAEDIGREEAGLLSLLQTGIGGEQALSSAGTTLSGASSDIRSNLGANLNTSFQNLGSAREASLSSGANTLINFAQFLNT